MYILISRNQTQKIDILKHTGADRKFNKNAKLNFCRKVYGISQNATQECFSIEITKILQDNTDITKINM